MALLLKRISFLFALLGIVFIPFPFNVFPYQTVITNFLFKEIIHEIAIHLFRLPHYYREITSDSSSLFILILLLIVISSILSGLLMLSKKWKIYESKILNLIYLIVCYYLILQLLNYGFDKIFKTQFYLPEPNILYTPFGKLDKDILYWSTMGTSYLYNLILGSIEAVAAFLLVFRKTRVIGLLVSLVIFINVIAVNLSFDISVKMYATFLFTLTLILLSPIFSKLYRFFVLNKPTRLNNRFELFHLFNHHFFKPVFKVFLLAVLLIEVFYPFLLTGNYNDDVAARPFLHGAYTVINNDNNEVPFKRVFIHRNGYMIFQDSDDSMIDYQLTIKNDELIITDYSLAQKKITYSYSEEKGHLTLSYVHQDKKYELICSELNWKSLPVMQNNFHWFVDDV